MKLVLPREPKPGQPIRAADISAIVRALRALTPSGGPGVRVSVTPNGTTISADVRRGGGGGVGSAVTFLMPVLVGGDKWSVTPGHINNQPPPVEGVPMASSDPKDWASDITSEGGIYAVCEFTMAEGEIQPTFTVEVMFASSTPTSTAYRGYYLLGKIFEISSDAAGKKTWDVVPYNASSLQASVNGATWMWYGPSTEWIPQTAKKEEA